MLFWLLISNQFCFSQFIQNGSGNLKNNPLNSFVGVGEISPTSKLVVKERIFDYNGFDIIDFGIPLLSLYGDNYIPAIGYTQLTPRNIMEAYIKPLPTSSFTKIFEITGDVNVGNQNFPMPILSVHNRAVFGGSSGVNSVITLLPSTNQMSLYIGSSPNWLSLYANAPNNGYINPITKSGDLGIFFKGSGFTIGSGVSGAVKGFRIQSDGTIEAGKDAIIGRDVDVERNLNVDGNAKISDFLAIGTNDPKGYKLAVNGSMIAELVKVKLNGNWPDFVFDDSYNLMPLRELKAYIMENHHLPNIPTQYEVENNDIDLGKMDALLLQKIEELTLYIFELESKITYLENQKK